MSASHDSDKTPNPQAPPDLMPEEPAQTPFNPGPEEPGQIPTHPVSGGAGQTPPIPVPEEPGQTPPSPVAPGCTPSANAPASAPGKTPAVDHDWVFKNLVQDYPQAALAFFAAGEKIGLDDDIEITFLGQEPPEEQMTEGKQILDVPMRVRWRDGSREDLVMCALPRHDCSVGESPTRPTCAPAGSTGSGAGGNEWTEALLEKAPTGGQQVMRAAT